MTNTWGRQSVTFLQELPTVWLMFFVREENNLSLTIVKPPESYEPLAYDFGNFPLTLPPPTPKYITTLASQSRQLFLRMGPVPVLLKKSPFCIKDISRILSWLWASDPTITPKPHQEQHLQKLPRRSSRGTERMPVMDVMWCWRPRANDQERILEMFQCKKGGFIKAWDRTVGWKIYTGIVKSNWLYTFKLEGGVETVLQKWQQWAQCKIEAWADVGGSTNWTSQVPLQKDFHMLTRTCSVLQVWLLLS